jgi:D-hexose-6-phosphate mutarotase
LSLSVRNRATHPIVFEQVLHSYSAVCDIAAVRISGLAGTAYIDKTQAGRREWQPAALVTVGAETDRVYLDTPAWCVIEDGGWCRRVLVEKNGAASTVAWNPWVEKGVGMADLGDPAWHGMVCVEAGNVADNEVRLAAGGEHEMSTAISVEDGQ